MVSFKDRIYLQVWDYSKNKYVTFPTPSEWGFETEDLDNKSFRSATTANMNRRRVNPDWAKINVTYDFITQEELKTYFPLLRPKQIKMKLFIPIFGNETQVYEAYVARKQGQVIKGTDAWKWTFNIVQSQWVSGQVN